MKLLHNKQKYPLANHFNSGLKGQKKLLSVRLLQVKHVVLRQRAWMPPPFQRPHCHLPGKKKKNVQLARVYKSGTPAAHLFRCNVCLQEARRLPATVTGCHGDEEKKREREKREGPGGERGEVEKRAPLCVPFFQKSLTGLMPSLLCM